MKVQDVLRERLLSLVGDGMAYANRKRMADDLGIDPAGLNKFLDNKKNPSGGGGFFL